MPATLIILMLLLSTLCGWLIAGTLIYLAFSTKEEKIFGLTVAGIVPENRAKLADDIAAIVVKNWMNEKELLSYLSGENIMEKLRPEIELHVDVFLKEKISETFPLLYKFMGEKTLSKFKEAFLEEVESIFPALLNSYASAILQEAKPEKIIAQKIKSMDTDELKRIIRLKAGNKLTFIKLLAAAIGLMMGILQIFLILFLK